MTSFALLLVIISALAHSAWNYLTKSSNHKIVFLWMMLIASGVIYIVPFCYRLNSHPIPADGWKYVLATCVIHSLYFSFLGMAYRKGDLSTVYPVARGTAPVLIPFLAWMFMGAGERPSALGAMGIALVVIGIQVVGLPGFSASALRRFWHDLTRGPVGFAFLTGLMTTLYTLVDRRGVYHIGIDPFVYIYLQMVITALFLMPWMVSRKREEIRYEWTVNRWRAAAVGLLCVGAYGIILWVMTLPVKVSYIAAGRECSILFSSLLGIIVLKEPRAFQKVIGAAVIVSGIVCITFAK